MNTEKLLGLLKRATVAGMEAVRYGQLCADTSSNHKRDGSNVTPTDLRSQDAIIAVLTNDSFCHGLDFNIVVEEKSKASKKLKPKPNADIIVFADSLDGTGGFKIGLSTATVILAAYDTIKKQIIACVVGDPSLGRIWSASQNQRTSLEWREFSFPKPLTEPLPRTVRKKEKLGHKSYVLMDVSHGFRHTSDDEVRYLFDELSRKVKVQLPGSNGLIQALVANGRDGIVGSVTSAISGPWDLAGVYLVIRAGGCVRAFDTKGLKVKEKNPLDIMSYDTAVTGNTVATVNKLAKIRLDAFRHRFKKRK